MMVISSEVITMLSRCKPTKETILAGAPAPDTIVVYDVNITKVEGKSAYAIRIPGDMNFEDGTKTRKMRLNFVMGIWYLQDVDESILLVESDAMINTMRKDADYMIALTDDHQIGRPHLYHPADSRYSYPYNVGSEIEDDKDRNCKASRWDGIRETLRRLFRARWTKTMILLGMLFTVIILILIGPILKSCLPGIVSGSVHSVRCPDGSTCESFLYLGADCVVYSYDCCAGELKQQTKPPGGLPDVLPWVIGGIVAIGLLGLGAYLLTRKKERKT